MPLKSKDLSYLLRFGVTTVLFHRRDPLVGSIILTDRCNLACRHCAVANITGTMYSYERILMDMADLFRSGVRVLLLYGGEPCLWTDAGKSVRDLVIAGKAMGFFLVNIVTNGTYPLDIPEADLIMVSLDGDRASHDQIRGATYDLILKHIREAPARNICLYMAVNQLNQDQAGHICTLARELPQVKACSFNLHTPYPGTEDLALSRAEKLKVCQTIAQAKSAGAPVLNLVRAFPALIDHTFKTPCVQCVIAENGRTWPCGRCVEIPGLCRQCGFAFAAELSLVFSGDLPVLAEFIRTYWKTF